MLDLSNTVSNIQNLNFSVQLVERTDTRGIGSYAEDMVVKRGQVQGRDVVAIV
jgi:hypothetical protein